MGRRLSAHARRGFVSLAGRTGTTTSWLLFAHAPYAGARRTAACKTLRPPRAVAVVLKTFTGTRLHPSRRVLAFVAATVTAHALCYLWYRSPSAHVRIRDTLAGGQPLPAALSHCLLSAASATRMQNTSVLFFRLRADVTNWTVNGGRVCDVTLAWCRHALLLRCGITRRSRSKLLARLLQAGRMVGRLILDCSRCFLLLTIACCLGLSPPGWMA